MSKKQNILYWVSTLWLCLGMVSTGIVQLIRMDEEVDKMNLLGYPEYFLTILGVWKIAGVIAVLIPGYTLIKEWAYAGFFFTMSGAIFSHWAVQDPWMEYFGPGLLLVLTVLSWYSRPLHRKFVKLYQN